MPFLTEDLTLPQEYVRGQYKGRLCVDESLWEKANHRIKVGSRGLVKGNGTFSQRTEVKSDLSLIAWKTTWPVWLGIKEREQECPERKTQRPVSSQDSEEIFSARSLRSSGEAGVRNTDPSYFFHLQGWLS